MNADYYDAHGRVRVARTRLLGQWRVTYMVAGAPWNEYFRTWPAAIRFADMIAHRRTW